MAFTMLVAIVTVHHSAFDARAGGMEYALTLGTVLIALALIGPGRITIANALAKVRTSGAASNASQPVAA